MVLNKEQLGMGAIFGATLIWSVSCFFYKNMLAMGWSVIAIAFVVRFFQFVGIATISKVKKESVTNIFQKDRKVFVANGICSFATPILFLLALNYTLVASAIFLQLLAPVWVAIFALFFLKESLTKVTALALSLAIIGVILVSNEGVALTNFLNEGFIFGILSGLFYAGDVLTGRKLKAYDSSLLSFWGSLIPLICFLPVLPFFFEVPAETLWVGLLLGGIYGAMKSFGAEFYFFSLKYVNASKVSILAMFDAVGNAFVAFLLFAEIPNNLAIVGYIAILSACAVLITQGHRHEELELVPVKVERD